MIRRYTVKNINNRPIDDLLNTTDLYTIVSIEDRSTRYAADDKEFAIIRKNDALVCEISEMTLLAEYFIPGIKKEILDLYEDLNDLRRMEIMYNNPHGR